MSSIYENQPKEIKKPKKKFQPNQQINQPILFNPQNPTCICTRCRPAWSSPCRPSRHCSSTGSPSRHRSRTSGPSCKGSCLKKNMMNILHESSFDSSHVLVWILADLRQNIVLYISHPLINCFWPR